jgi:hypothetical protein
MKILLKTKNAFSILFIAICCAAPVTAQQAKISTAAEIKEDINLNVCKNADRLESVRKLFVKMGAAEKDIKIEKIKDVENLVVVHKGKSEEIVVVGAHYDKVADGF